MSDEPLTNPIDAEFNTEELEITANNNSLTFDLDALTDDQELTFPDANSKPLIYNATSISTSTLPAGANNTFYGQLAGTNVTTGTNNSIFGYNAQSGAAAAVSRFVLGGTGQFDDCTHINTTDIDIPNLTQATHANMLFWDPVTGKLGFTESHAIVATDWANGSAASPSESFYNDANTGVYLVGADVFGIAAGGVLSASFGAQMLINNGGAATPALAFFNDSNTGIYRIAADQIGMSLGGVQYISITSELTYTTANTDYTRINLTNTTSTRTYVLENGGSAGGSLSSLTEVGANTFGIRVTGTGLDRFIHKWNENQSMVYSGTAALPSYSFYQDTDKGMFLSAEDTLGWSVGNTLRMSLSTTALTNTLPVIYPAGTVFAPSMTFTSDTDCGGWRPSSKAITLSTALNDSVLINIGVSTPWGIASIRQNDAGAINYLWNMQVDGDSFDTYIYGGYAQTSSTTGYQFILNLRDGGTAWYVRGDGATFSDNAYSSGGADYSEWFEANNEIPVGSSVVLEQGKIRVAQPGEEAKVIGVIRPKNSNGYTVVGNSAEDYWAGKFLKDEFGQFIMEPVDYYKWVDPSGEHKGYYTNQIPNGVTVPENKEVVPAMMKKINPAYDPQQSYTARSKRPEWHIVGMLGQIPVKNGQVLGQRWQLMKDASSNAKIYLVRK